MVKLENNENDNEETSNKPDNDIPHDPYFPPIVSLPEVENRCSENIDVGKCSFERLNMVQLLQCRFCEDEYAETQIEIHLFEEHGGVENNRPKENVIIDHDDDESNGILLSPNSNQNITVPTGEDEENELFKMRAKLFRFDSAADPPEWKERGTGDMKLLQQKDHLGKIRVLMRRDKTLKICANHFVQPWMLLEAMKGSDRAWMWMVQADYADEEAKSETLAIRFANTENAKKFKDAFDNAVLKVIECEANRITGTEHKDQEIKKTTNKIDENDPSEKLATLTIQTEKEEETDK